MTIASEFYDMAKEMLDDPEVGFDGAIVVTERIDGPMPWKPNIGKNEIPIRYFYSSQKATTVNGSPVMSGERVFICYRQDLIDIPACIGSSFIDHNNKRLTINAVEEIGAGNEAIIFKVKVGI